VTGGRGTNDAEGHRLVPSTTAAATGRRANIHAAFIDNAHKMRNARAQQSPRFQG
jgi:hypothetical protein